MDRHIIHFLMQIVPLQEIDDEVVCILARQYRADEIPISAVEAYFAATGKQYLENYKRLDQEISALKQSSSEAGAGLKD